MKHDKIWPDFLSKFGNIKKFFFNYIFRHFNEVFDTNSWLFGSIYGNIRQSKFRFSATSLVIAEASA